MKKYGIICGILNSIILVVLFAAFLLPILLFVDLLVLKIVLIVAALLLTAFLEQWVFSRFVNQIVEKVMMDKKEEN